MYPSLFLRHYVSPKFLVLRRHQIQCLYCGAAVQSPSRTGQPQQDTATKSNPSSWWGVVWAYLLPCYGESQSDKRSDMKRLLLINWGPLCICICNWSATKYIKIGSSVFFMMAKVYEMPQIKCPISMLFTRRPQTMLGPSYLQSKRDYRIQSKTQFRMIAGPL